MNTTKKNETSSDSERNKRLIEYSMQLGMLRILLNANELTEKEYNTVRMSLMRDYNMYPHMLWD